MHYFLMKQQVMMSYLKDVLQIRQPYALLSQTISPLSLNRMRNRSIRQRPGQMSSTLKKNDPNTHIPQPEASDAAMHHGSRQGE